MWIEKLIELNWVQKIINRNNGRHCRVEIEATAGDSSVV